MPKLVTFVIPVRSNRNIRDHRLFQVLLEQTARSIYRQSSAAWMCVVVADGETALPDLPPNFRILRVSFPPNEFHERATSPDEARRAVRHDKGQRILAGIISAKESCFVMPVDDDDLLDRHLVEFLTKHPDTNGWFVEHGFEFWEARGDVWSIPIENFWRVCGTCNIFRREQLPLPDRADYTQNDLVSELLGGHVGLKPFLDRQGVPLAPLPFRAVAYRRGHANSHSSLPLAQRHMFRRHVLNKGLLTQPMRNIANFFRLDRNSKSFREQFLEQAHTGIGNGS